MQRLSWIFAFLIVVIVACSTSERAVNDGKKKEVDLKKEKNKYEIIVTDPGFESWFEYHKSDARDHAESYYKNWNEQYVHAWNLRAMTQSSFFTNTIDYDGNTDYGLDIERELYYYFRWVETELKRPILEHPRPDGVF